MIDILIFALYGVLIGFSDFTNMSYYLKKREPELSEEFGLSEGVPSAFMCGCGISIGQKEVGEKTNEIPEIPKLLDLIDITDCTVTIDAIGTQKDIMDKIIDKGGHFCLLLKENQHTAFEDVDLFFNDLEKNDKKEFKKLSSYTETAKDYGRIEKREYYTYV